MKVDLEFIGSLKKTKIFNSVIQIPREHNVYEYHVESYDEGDFYGTLYLEHEIINIYNETIGFFGINFEHKVIAYNLKRENIRDKIIDGGYYIERLP